MNSCFRAVSFLLFTAAYFFLSPRPLLPSSPSFSFLSVHSNLVKDYSLVIHRDCNNLSNCFSTMLNFIFYIISSLGASLREEERVWSLRRIRRCRVIIREKRISRFIYHRMRERKGTRVRVRNTRGRHSIRTRSGRGKVNPLIMSEIRGTRFAETNDSGTSGKFAFV